MVIVQEQILIQCQAVLKKAGQLFPKLDLRGISFKFDLRGHQAGQTRRDWGEYCVRFNREYAEHDVNHILVDTVPHEIAHIVRFMQNDGTHGREWKKVCVDLGGTALTTHTIPKVFCKGRTYEYVTTTGYAVRVSEHMHNRIQGGASYRYSKVEGDVHKDCDYKVI